MTLLELSRLSKAGVLYNKGIFSEEGEYACWRLY